MAAALTSRVVMQTQDFRGSVKPLKTSAVRKAALVPRSIACSAEKSNVGTVVAAAALAAVVGLSSVDAAFADISGLTPCSESAAYAKREKKELKGLNKRLAQYEAGSAPALALQATMDRTTKRFANYAKSGVLCGTDGLPHLISDPGLALRYGHAGETLIPTLGFLYVAGYIGYVGRSYLIAAKAEKKPTEKEIIIDVPLALELSFKGAGWPFAVFTELKRGTLTESDANITVSPR